MLTLAGLEPALRLVDDVKTPTTTDNLAIPVTDTQRLD
jgi:hypothetical protein